jgi:hypothetical protein
LINFWWQRSSGDAVVSGLNPAAWFRFGQGITSAGGLVSQWNDQTTNARHLKQATGTNQPALNADGSILFDGVDNFMKCTAFTLNQPETVYVLFQQVTYTGGFVFDGNALDAGEVLQQGSSPELRMFAGTLLPSITSLAVGVYGILVCVFNGASSSFQHNLNSPTTGNCGAANMGGFTLAAKGDNTVWGNIQVKECIIFAGAHDAATRTLVIGYLASVGGLSI